MQGIFDLPALSSTAGVDSSVKDFLGKWVVLYFYPKDNTPGCRREGEDFNALYDEFCALGAQVVGISRDNLASHQRFKEKAGFRFDLLSDVDGVWSEFFMVLKDKQMFGRKYKGIERSTFLLNAQGEVVRSWRKVKVAGHAEEVLGALRALLAEI